MRAALQLAAEGKLNRVETATEFSIGAVNHRLCVSDSNSGLKFLIDTGANVSVLPKSVISKNIVLSDDQSYTLYAANGTEIKTFGTKTLDLDLNLRRVFR